MIASQQEQLAQLARQWLHASQISRNSQIFKLAEFNPDTSNYAIEEWQDNATKLKNELHVSDILMIVKAGNLERLHLPRRHSPLPLQR
jgi:hypothetical protein